jgi:hypothetical protein
MEEELVLQTPPPPKSHPDDPFIILRSDHSLRGTLSNIQAQNQQKLSSSRRKE